MNKKEAIKEFLNLDFFSQEHETKKEEETTSSEIRVFGEIWEGSLWDFDESLQKIGSENLEILINSPGGSVFDGVAMAAMVKRLQNNTTTTGIGFVASIASVLLLAGDTVQLNRDAFLMIHNAWAFEAGEAKEMRKTARILDKISDQIANVYVSQIEKAGKLIDGDKDKTKERVKSLMDKETWFTAQEALDFGLIDSISDGMEEEEPTKEEIELILNKYSATAPVQFLNKFKSTEQMSDNKETLNQEQESFWNKVVNFFKGSPNKVEDLQQELKAQEDAEIQKAIEIAKENGFYKEPASEEIAETPVVEEAPVVENNAEQEVEAEAVSETQEVETLEATNEKDQEIKALKDKLKAIEEKLGSPSAGDGPKKQSPAQSKENLYAPDKKSKEFLDGFSKLFQ